MRISTPIPSICSPKPDPLALFFLWDQLILASALQTDRGCMGVCLLWKRWPEWPDWYPDPLVQLFSVITTTRTGFVVPQLNDCQWSEWLKHFLRGEVKMRIRCCHPQNMSANQRAKGISNSYIHHTLMSLPWWYMMENTISRFSVSRRLAGVCSRIYSNNRRITRSRVLLLFLLRLVVPVSLMWLFLVQITSIRNLVGNGWWFCTSANRSVRVVTLLSIFQRIISWSDIITNLCFDSCHRPVRIALPSFLHFVLYSVSVRPQQIMHAIVAINQSDLFDVWISTYMWATMRG